MKKFENLWTKKGEENFAWRWLRFWGPPACPTSDEIDYLRKFITKLKNKKKHIEVMILGSTSEYRDLMVELGVKATIVDFSKKNFICLSFRGKYFEEYHKTQMFVEQKWQEIKINKKFDLVLAHFALNVNPYKVWDRIFDRVSFHLKEGGLFITNNWVRFGDKLFSINEIIDEYNSKWQKDYDFFGSMMPKLYLSEAYNLEREYLELPRLSSLIEKAFKQGLISRKDYQIYLNMGYNKFGFKLFINKENHFIECSKKHFLIQDRIYFDSYPNSKYMPEWVLTKKH